MTGNRLRGPQAVLVVVMALFGALPVTMYGAYYLTPLITGWRKHPDVIQGCDSSVHCAEMNTFVVVWGLSLFAYGLLCAWAYRRGVRRAARTIDVSETTGSSPTAG